MWLALLIGSWLGLFLPEDSAEKPEPAAEPSAGAALLAACQKLHEDEGEGWRIVFDPRGLAAELTGGASANGGTSEGAARDFLKKHGRLFGLSFPGASLAEAEVTEEEEGVRRVVFATRFEKLEVVDGSIVVRLDSEGRILQVLSRAWPVLRLVTKATIDGERAEAIVRRAVDEDEFEFRQSPRLAVRREGGGRLVWVIPIEAKSKPEKKNEPLQTLRCLIDAHSGVLVEPSPALLHP